MGKFCELNKINLSYPHKFSPHFELKKLLKQSDQNNKYKKLLTQPILKQLSVMCTSVFFPCLIVSKLSKSLSVELLSSAFVLPCLILTFFKIFKLLAKTNLQI